MIRKDIYFFKSDLLFPTHTSIRTIAAYIQKLRNLIGYRKVSWNFIFNNLKELLLDLIDVHSCCVFYHKFFVLSFILLIRLLKKTLRCFSPVSLISVDFFIRFCRSLWQASQKTSSLVLI